MGRCRMLHYGCINNFFLIETKVVHANFAHDNLLVELEAFICGRCLYCPFMDQGAHFLN